MRTNRLAKTPGQSSGCHGLGKAGGEASPRTVRRSTGSQGISTRAFRPPRAEIPAFLRHTFGTQQLIEQAKLANDPASESAQIDRGNQIASTGNSPRSRSEVSARDWREARKSWRQRRPLEQCSLRPTDECSAHKTRRLVENLICPSAAFYLTTRSGVVDENSAGEFGGR